MSYPPPAPSLDVNSVKNLFWSADCELEAFNSHFFVVRNEEVTAHAGQNNDESTGMWNAWGMPD